MRALKERIDYLKKYEGSKDDINALKTRYTTYLERYEDFSKKMGLPFQPERIHTMRDIKGDKINPSMEMEKEISSIYDKVINNDSIDRNQITAMFSKQMYKLGINPYNGKVVNVLSKDLSYIIKKHGKEIGKEDLVNMKDVLHYKYLYHNSGITEEEKNGYRFYKPSSNGEGWLEGATKTRKNGEEIFHFMYMNNHKFEVKQRKMIDLLIDDRNN